jgi:hypothetical protein
MNKQTEKSKQIQRHLDLHGIPYLKLDGTINLLIMRANSSSHYAVIEFFELSDEYYKSDRMKTFTFTRLWGETKDKIVNRLGQYLNN